MALDFDAASRASDHGSFNLPDTCTLLGWGRELVLSGSNKRAFYKNSGGGVQCWVGNPFYGNGGMRWFRNRATTSTDLQALSMFTSTTEWVFFAIVDGDDAATGRILRGTLTTPVAEVSYNTQTQGSGAKVSGEDTANMNIFGAGSGFSSSTMIGGYCWVYDHELTDPEMDLHRLMPRTQLSGCLLCTEYGLMNGTGTQVDLSGSGNNGTLIASPVAADHVPLTLRPRRKHFVIPAAGGLSIPVAMHHYKQLRAA